MIKKTALFALAQSALMVTVLLCAPLMADAASSIGPSKPGLLTPPMDNRITDTERDTTFRRTADPDRVTNITNLDRELASRVEQSLEPYRGISVEAEKGTIRLRGSVDTVQERNALIERARGVYGVQSVYADIDVNGVRY